ncbi:MAG: hypothetical protein PHE49_11845, partial [bacterium]|nr:hypothetical protein [bacterium]
MKLKHTINSLTCILLTILSLSCTMYSDYEMWQGALNRSPLFSKIEKYEISHYGFIPIFYSIPKWSNENTIYFVEYTNKNRKKAHLYNIPHTWWEFKGSASIIGYNLITEQKDTFVSIPCSTSTIIDFAVSPDGKKLVYSTIDIPANAIFYRLFSNAMFYRVFSNVYDREFLDTEDYSLYMENFKKIPTCITFIKELQNDSVPKVLSKSFTLCFGFNWDSQSKKLAFQTGEYKLKQFCWYEYYKEHNIFDAMHRVKRICSWYGDDPYETTMDNNLNLISHSNVLIDINNSSSVVKLPTGNILNFSEDGSKIFFMDSVSGNTRFCSVDTSGNNLQIIVSKIECDVYNTLWNDDLYHVKRPFFIPTKYACKDSNQILIYPVIHIYHNNIIPEIVDNELRGIVFYNIKTNKRDSILFGNINIKDARFISSWDHYKDIRSISPLSYAISPDNKKIGIFPKIESDVLKKKDMYICNYSKEIEQMLKRIN